MMLNRSELFSALMHMGIYPTEEELVATEEKLHIGVDADHHETPISRSGFLAIVLDYEVKPLVQESPDDRRFVRALRRHFIAHARMVTIDVQAQVGSGSGRATSASPRGGVDDDARSFARSLGLAGESAAKARELFAMLSAVGGAEGAELRAKLSEVVRGAAPSASADGGASSSSAAAAATLSGEFIYRYILCEFC